MTCVANFILKISISRQNHAIHICIHASLAATGEYFCAVGLRSTQLQCYLDTRSLNVFNDNSINITLGHITITGSCSVLLGCPTECGTLQSIETSNQGKLFTIGGGGEVPVFLEEWRFGVLNVKNWVNQRSEDRRSEDCWLEDVKITRSEN